ncbi:MAG: IreB family regulatory phosphoprotein [Eubacteriales bacterium]|nr:IreB family regulatory phosphoprotein [Clostridia bacterium]MDY2846362.1 IreB family regulatory phosphoprotein [Eubacteriales bacterium]
MKNEMDKTITFSIREEERDRERKMLLRTVYDALSEKGYNPINQLVGYVLTEDPTYITNYKNARGLIRRIDRDELMAALLTEYLGL